MQINRQTYEPFFLLYVDGELTSEERAEVEHFAAAHPDLKEELELLQQSVFIADENIIFEPKESLYRQEKDRAAVILTSATKSIGWKKIAAAAAVLFLIGAAGWLYTQKQSGHAPTPAPGQLAVRPAGAAPDSSTSTPETSSAQVAPAISKRELAAVPRSGIQPADRRAKKTRTTGKSTVQQTKASSASGPANDLTSEEPIALRATTLRQDLAHADPDAQKIDVPVKARNLAIPAPSRSTAIQYVDENDPADNDRIYFANTSFSKKNNLRVVFRKASRLIDRITSLQ